VHYFHDERAIPCLFGDSGVQNFFGASGLRCFHNERAIPILSDASGVQYFLDERATQSLFGASDVQCFSDDDWVLILLVNNVILRLHGHRTQVCLVPVEYMTYLVA
jgi:hypothetical protein